MTQSYAPRMLPMNNRPSNRSNARPLMNTFELNTPAGTVTIGDEMIVEEDKMTLPHMPFIYFAGGFLLARLLNRKK